MQGPARDAAFDTLCASITTAPAADRTLGGLCDWVEAEAPPPVDLAVKGAARLKAAVIPVGLRWPTANLPGERPSPQENAMAGAGEARVRMVLAFDAVRGPFMPLPR